MATITSKIAFTLDSFNLNQLVEDTDYLTMENEMTPWSDYPDQFGYGVDFSTFIAFGGDAIQFANGKVTGGTVNNVMLIDDANESYKTLIELDGLSISATQAVKAVQTVSGADDLKLLKSAFRGADSFVLSNKNDVMSGFNGNDTMSGKNGRDALSGDGGKDTLYGDGSNDTLSGGAGNDRLHGGKGADQLTGGAGADMLFGGMDGQRDVFVFTSASESKAGQRDTIQEFQSQDDIDLRGIDANGDMAGDQAFGFGSKAASHAVWTVDAGKDLLVRADVTGDGKADLEIKVMGVDQLLASDFLL